MKAKKAASTRRHDPLLTQLTAEKSLENDPKAMRKFNYKQSKNADLDEEEPQAALVDRKTSRRILNIVREQQEEVEREALEESLPASGVHDILAKKLKAQEKISMVRQFKHQQHLDSDEEEEDDDDMNEQEYEAEMDGADALECDPEEMALLEKFMTKEPRKQVNLSDLVMSKLSQAASHQESLESQDDTTTLRKELSTKVVEVYTKVGLLLSRYRSGKLPKTFKIIPSLNNWEDILFLTRPETWTPHATYQATRVFVSNLKAHLATRFFEMFLLDRVRDDIAANKKLNYHLYMALKKALYKPAAFFKGLLLPLCLGGNCTLREAVIIGSVLTRVSIPMLHSAAALLKLAEMEYSGANSLFIRVLLDKKYALPYRVIDGLVFHFLRFKGDPRGPLPVLWHQSLLVFAQRYKSDMTDEQKEALLELIKDQHHVMISPEIRRELQNSTCRSEEQQVLPDVEML